MTHVKKCITQYLILLSISRNLSCIAYKDTDNIFDPDLPDACEPDLKHCKIDEVYHCLPSDKDFSTLIHIEKCLDKIYPVQSNHCIVYDPDKRMEPKLVQRQCKEILYCPIDDYSSDTAYRHNCTRENTLCERSDNILNVNKNESKTCQCQDSQLYSSLGYIALKTGKSQHYLWYNILIVAVLWIVNLGCTVIFMSYKYKYINKIRSILRKEILVPESTQNVRQRLTTQDEQSQY